MPEIKKSLSEYALDYPDSYGYDSMKALYDACSESYSEKMDTPDPPKDRDAWIWRGKRFIGAKAFVRAAMLALKEKHLDRHDAMVVSPEIARSLQRHPGSNRRKSIIWKRLGNALLDCLGEVHEDEKGRLGRIDQDGFIGRFAERHGGEITWKMTLFEGESWDDVLPDGYEHDYGNDVQTEIDENEGLLIEGPVLPEAYRDIEGKEREALIKVRVNQSSFRKKLLKHYKGKCCITGLNVESLLIASHIKPWAESEPIDKLAVENGLLLNALHDYAFERHLITVDKKDEDYIVKVSNSMAESNNPAVVALLREYCGEKIYVPSSFNLDDFDRNLSWHREKFNEKEKESTKTLKK